MARQVAPTPPTLCCDGQARGDGTFLNAFFDSPLLGGEEGVGQYTVTKTFLGYSTMRKVSLGLQMFNMIILD